MTLDNSAAKLDAYKGSGIGGDLTATGGILNFYLPGNIAANDTLLTVGGAAEIDGSTVGIYID